MSRGLEDTTAVMSHLKVNKEVDAIQSEKQKNQTNVWRYCVSSHPPERCLIYGKRCWGLAKMNHNSGLCRNTSHAVHKLEQDLEDGQIDMVNIKFFNSN